MADDQILGRIRALLAKAADTDFPEEAKVFAERAQELMAKYQIMVLEAQCVTAMMRATNPSPRDSTRKFRSDFVVGFAAEIRERLRERRRRATREYGAASAASVALVMRDRSAIVDDAFRREFPHVRSGRARRVGAGYGSGRRAGAGADIGSVRLRGGRRAIGAG